MDKNVPKLYSKAMWRNWFPVLAAILSLTACGYDQSISWNLPNLSSFTRDIVSKDPVALATFQSLTDFSGMIAAIFMPLMYDFRGRKFAFYWGSIISTISIIVSTIGTVFGSQEDRIYFYYIGRFITIIAIDVSAGCSFMYAAEISHPAHRAFFGGLFGLAWGLGSIINNLVIFMIAFAPDDAWQWRIPTLLQAVFSIALLIMTPFLPESPRTLFAKGDRAGAEKIIREWVGCNISDESFVANVMEELDEALKHCAPSSRVLDVYNMKPLWATANARRRVFLLLIKNAGLTLLSWGISGGVFETLIFEVIGLNDPKVKAGLTFGGAMVNMIWSFTVCGYLERWGRRRTVLVAYAASCVSFLLYPIAMEGYHATKGTAFVALFIANIFLYQICNSPMGPAHSVFESELLAYDYRAKGKALNDFTLKPANIAASYIQASFYKLIDFRSFWLAASFLFFVTIFYYVMMPETKGRTLEEVDEIFDHPSPIHTLFMRNDGPNYVQHSLMVLKIKQEYTNIDTGPMESNKLPMESVELPKA
ncbi:hypothetical protein HK098_001706 [Nowakowskiella sp. JEL0407]|nr:hypothetical protein HK098_001706 [Nowakowskiella sp. JEL0407]